MAQDDCKSKIIKDKNIINEQDTNETKTQKKIKTITDGLMTKNSGISVSDYFAQKMKAKGLDPHALSSARVGFGIAEDAIVTPSIEIEDEDVHVKNALIDEIQKTCDNSTELIKGSIVPENIQKKLKKAKKAKSSDRADKDGSKKSKVSKKLATLSEIDLKSSSQDINSVKPKKGKKSESNESQNVTSAKKSSKSVISNESLVEKSSGSIKSNDATEPKSKKSKKRSRETEAEVKEKKVKKPKREE